MHISKFFLVMQLTKQMLSWLFPALRQGPDIFQQRVLPFGSVALVTAFLRVAHALWKLGSKLLKLMWTSYFDDIFFSIVEEPSCKHTDLIIMSLFTILGWRFSTKTLLDYSTVCKVLRVQFDLRMSGGGLSFVSNTDDRVTELCASIDEVIATGKLNKSEGEKLRGRLPFASGQLFGRYARNRIRVLSQHIQSGRHSICDDTAHALNCIRERISANIPRGIIGTLSDHIHV